MSTTINKAIGEGAGVEIYAALAYNSADKFGGYQIKDLMTNTTYKHYFYDTSQYIYSSASGTLNIVGATVAVTGNLTISGTCTITGSLTYGATAVPVATGYMGTLTVGIDGTGYDVKFYSATSTKYFLWDESADGVVLVGTFTETGNMAVTGTFTLTGAPTITGNTAITGTLGVTGTTTLTGALNVGVDGTGYDVTFFGETSTYQFLWDQNQDTNGGVTIKGTYIQTGAMTVTGAVTVVGNESITGDVTLVGAIAQTGNTAIVGTLTVGIDATGHDVIFYGETTTYQFFWDQNQNTNGGVTIVGTLIQTGAVTITGAVGITGAITMATTQKIQLRDTGIYLYSSIDGTADFVADTILNLTCPTINLVGSTAILLDGDTTINAAHTFTTGTGAATFLGQIVTSYNGNPSVSIGSSATPLTTATTAYSALKCWSNYSLGTAGYHVGAWFISMYTATSTWAGSVFALRGSAGVSATETTVNTAGQIIGVHGRILSTGGTLYNAGVMYAGVLGQVCIGGTWTAANKVAAGWFDWQLNTQVAAGDTMILYLSNNANSGTANLNPTNVMYIYAPYMTNFFNLNAATNGGMVTASATAGTMTHTVKCLIDGVAAYLHFFNA